MSPLLPHVLLTVVPSKLVLYSSLTISIISSLAGITVAKELQALTTFVLGVLLREFPPLLRNVGYGLRCFVDLDQQVDSLIKLVYPC